MSSTSENVGGLTKLARGIFRHRLPILIATVVLMVGSIVLGVSAFGKLKSGGFNDPASASAQATNVIDSEFGGTANLIFLVTPKNSALEVNDPQVAAAGNALTNQLAASSGVTKVASWWSTGSPGLRSTDGHQALVTAHVVGDDATSSARAKQLVTTLAVDNPVITISAGGALGTGNNIGTQVGKDLGLAEGIAVPLTLLLLLLAFGSITAALLPIAIGALAVFGTFAELSLLGSATDVSIYAINLTTALGLGLAIDYSLLMVSRFREALAAGQPTETALAQMMNTAGRTIIFSSLTVAVALSALLVFPLYFLRSFAYAGIGVVAVALFGALITLPALLATLGGRVNSGRIRRSRPIRSASEETPMWRHIATTVMRHPIVSGAPVVAVLLLLAVPFFHVNFAVPDDRVLQPTASGRQVGDALRANFAPGDSAAVIAVVEGKPSNSALTSYATHLSSLPSVQSVDSAAGEFAGGHLVAGPTSANSRFSASNADYLNVLGPADTSSPAALKLVADVRASTPPPGTTVLVGGASATLIDSNQSIANSLPLAIALIAASTFILLFLFTGSVLLPVKALLLNLLSLTGVFGAMVWIFQDGHGSSLLGFTPGPINTSMPILLFCIAFGLSMDYEVFLLSRIKELRDHGASNSEAVAGGLARTGRIVSTAAALLSVTFLAFGTSKVSFIQMFGIGTAIAILIDATVIRGVLVPAFMQLAGGANWWAPGPLRRLHQRIGLTEKADANI